MSTQTATEQLEAAYNWIGWCHAEISEELRCPEDAIKLWRAAVNNDWPYADEWSSAALYSVLGYDPRGQHERYERLLAKMREAKTLEELKDAFFESLLNPKFRFEGDESNEELSAETAQFFNLVKKCTEEGRWRDAEAFEQVRKLIIMFRWKRRTLGEVA